MKKLVIFFLIIASLVLLWNINRWLQQWIRPRKSFARLLFYLLAGLSLAFIYTFLFVLLISNLFPLPKR